MSLETFMPGHTCGYLLVLLIPHGDCCTCTVLPDIPFYQLLCPGTGIQPGQVGEVAVRVTKKRGGWKHQAAGACSVVTQAGREGTASPVLCQEGAGSSSCQTRNWSLPTQSHRSLLVNSNELVPQRRKQSPPLMRVSSAR